MMRKKYSEYKLQKQLLYIPDFHMNEVPLNYIRADQICSYKKLSIKSAKKVPISPTKQRTSKYSTAYKVPFLRKYVFSPLPKRKSINNLNEYISITCGTRVKFLPSILLQKSDTNKKSINIRARQKVLIEKSNSQPLFLSLSKPKDSIKFKITNGRLLEALNNQNEDEFNNKMNYKDYKRILLLLRNNRK